MQLEQQRRYQRGEVFLGPGVPENMPPTRLPSFFNRVGHGPYFYDGLRGGGTQEQPKDLTDEEMIRMMRAALMATQDMLYCVGDVCRALAEEYRSRGKLKEAKVFERYGKSLTRPRPKPPEEKSL